MQQDNNPKDTSRAISELLFTKEGFGSGIIKVWT